MIGTGTSYWTRVCLIVTDPNGLQSNLMSKVHAYLYMLEKPLQPPTGLVEIKM